MKSQFLHHTGVASGGTPCPTCGKRRFLTKADAKTVARQMKGRRGRLNAYRCGDFWHLGHLPKPVARGRLTRDDLQREDR